MEFSHPKTASYKVQYLHFMYLKLSVTAFRSQIGSKSTIRLEFTFDLRLRSILYTPEI